jgi:periplasmic protein TonB
MEARKNENLDLDKKRHLFFNIGLVISLLMVIMAFEMHFPYVIEKIDIDRQPPGEFAYVPPTVQDMPMPPLPDNKKQVSLNEIAKSDPDVLVPPELLPVIVPEPVGSYNPNIGYNFAGPGKEPDADEIFIKVERQPEPVGGYDKFYEYIRKNLKYPSAAKNNGIEGKVLIGFVVDKDGYVTQAEVLKGIGFGCDEEAIRVISNFRWQPGQQRGVPVKVRMAFPIVFVNQKSR